MRGVMLLGNKQQDFILAEKIVRAAIHRIDPYGLLEGGSPEDEFDSEIRSITNQLQRCKTESDIAHAIARTLTSSFGEKFDPSEFREESNRVFLELKENEN